MVEYYNIFAILNENDVVQEVLLLQNQKEADELAYKLFISGKAIKVNNLDVKVGDFYRHNTFYRCVNPEDYEFGIEVDSTEPIINELNYVKEILAQKESQIEYLENLLRENGLEKLIE